MSKELTKKQLSDFRTRFEASPERTRLLNAVTRTEINQLALRREVFTTTHQAYTHKLDEWEATNQKASGRCWCFAGLNLLRVGAMKEMGLKSFEFSQNWTLFWDKIERANYFLEAILETADRSLEDRTVDFLLATPIGDGGQWHMFVSLVNKYGLVPKAVMPESHSSGATAMMNQALCQRLRQAARDLRAAEDASARASLKAEAMESIHGILCLHLGHPPERVQWSWQDSDKNHHRIDCTPHEFVQRYVTVDVNDYVCLVNDPRPEHPYDKTYTVEFLGNVVGGVPVRYLNVETELMRAVTRQTIVDGEPVWMGCDVGKMFHRKEGMWDAELYDYAGIYDFPYDLDKADRLRLRHSAMSHAMLFTGVDIEQTGTDATVKRWRVENSWGTEGGQKGFYVMNDNWFDEHVFEVAIHRNYIDEKLLAALEEDPTVLPAWDPMGSLA